MRLLRQERRPRRDSNRGPSVPMASALTVTLAGPGRNNLYRTNFSGGTTILTVGGVVFGTRKMEMTKEKRIQDKYEKYEA